jgi:hypothetical protein
VDALGRQPGIFWVTVAAAGVAVIGALGPWVTALGIISKAGVDGDGLYVIGAAVFTVAFVWNHAQTGGRGVLIAAAVLGLIATGICVYTLVDVEQNSPTDFFGERVDLVRPGWGLYASLLGAGGWTIASLMMWRLAGAGRAAAPRA